MCFFGRCGGGEADPVSEPGMVPYILYWSESQGWRKAVKWDWCELVNVDTYG